MNVYISEGGSSATPSMPPTPHGEKKTRKGENLLLSKRTLSLMSQRARMLIPFAKRAEINGENFYFSHFGEA